MSRYSTLQLAANSSLESEPPASPAAAATAPPLSLSLPLPSPASSPLPPAISINTQEARTAAAAAVAAPPEAVTASPSPPSSPLEKLVLPARGVPDGCGLEILSAMSPSIPLPSPHELLNLKKGRRASCQIKPPPHVMRELI